MALDLDQLRERVSPRLAGGAVLEDVYKFIPTAFPDEFANEVHPLEWDAIDAGCVASAGTKLWAENSDAGRDLVLFQLSRMPPESLSRYVHEWGLWLKVGTGTLGAAAHSTRKLWNNLLEEVEDPAGFAGLFVDSQARDALLTAVARSTGLDSSALDLSEIDPDGILGELADLVQAFVRGDRRPEAGCLVGFVDADDDRAWVAGIVDEADEKYPTPALVVQHFKWVELEPWTDTGGPFEPTVADDDPRAVLVSCNHA